MKPILFDGSATSFNSNGLGALSDCISCLVTEERNGIYEVEFEYPITGVRYESITSGRIVLVSHDEQKDLQPFIIYHISKPISGVVTVNAHHISYRLNNVIVSPFTASSISVAFMRLRLNSITYNPFDFWTDMSRSGNLVVDVPTPIRGILGGVQGSILDVFGGGEYEFDKYMVKLYAHRGTNNGVTIRYGKNLTDITAETNAGGLYNAVVPYWSDGSGSVVYGGVVSGNGGVIREETWTDEHGVSMQDENGDTLTFNASLQQVSTMDLSAEFDEAPTTAQLESRAQAILNNNTPWIPKENIRVDFVALWQTEEYKNIAALERVRLCDTVTVQYEELGVDATAKVIKVVWDVLTERYTEIELGEARSSFADTIMAATDEKLKEYPSKSFLEEAVDHATQQITGGLGGNIVFTLNTDGKPIEQLIMDTDDKDTAVNVWRWNLGGLGHSHNGYNGPFDDVAITQDGQINASMITVGTMRADRIEGGTLKLGGSDTDGEMVVYDSQDNLLARLSRDGIDLRASDGVRTASINSGYTKYYFGDDIIGSVGTDVDENDTPGLVFDLVDADGYIGWFENGASNPILIYGSVAWLDKDVWIDTLSACADVHIADGYTLASSRIADPLWQFNGTNYAGRTGTITISGVRLTFNNGILTATS